MPNVLFINGISDDGRVKVHKIIDNNTLQYLNQGTCNVCNMLEHGNFDKQVLVLDSNPSQQINLDNIDLIFNQISDPDSHKISIAKARKVCDQLKQKTYCINHPDKIIKTSREYMFDLLKDNSEIVIPQTIKFEPSCRAQVNEKIEQLAWSYPILIRKSGDHNAASLIKLDTSEDIKKLHPSYFERECYLTEYVDFSDDKGVYSKYRFVSVNGNFFIRHVMYGDQWEIHSHVRKQFMKDNDAYFSLENDTIANFADDLKKNIESPMKYIHDALGLEYFGVDCGIDKDGRLVIFEANANMNLLYNPYPKPNVWQTQVEAIHDEVVTMIEDFSAAPVNSVNISI